MIPVVIERTSRGERTIDIYSRLLMERNIFLTDRIETSNATDIVSQMLYLDSVTSEMPINLYINSPGGSVIDGYSILNCMSNLKSKINGYVIGQACSMASVILACCSMRYAFIYSMLMIHQPKSGMFGQVTDLEIHAENVKEMKYTLTKIIADNCKQPFEKVSQDMERDYFMNAKQALEYGLIDEIL